MSRVFFTADLHLGHANIIKYTKRPQLKLTDLDDTGNWVSEEVKALRAEQMNEFLIRNWNSRVRPDDTVFNIGDFCCKGSERGVSGVRTKASEWLAQLNGTVVHILGNHDRNNTLRHGLSCAYMQLGKRTAFLVHNPRHLPQHPVDVVLHGHVHTAWAESVLETPDHRKVVAINVGVDVRKYAPIALDEVMGLVEKRTKELYG